MHSHAKAWLTRLGAALPQRSLDAARAALNYMQLGRGMRELGFRPTRLPTRWAVFDDVAARVRDERVLYLEFGVAYGDSIKYWASRLRHPETRLHGFDSFQGLPAAWGPYDRGFFDQAGHVPMMSDPRIAFFKGWFEDTLPKYQPPPHDRLVVLVDSDLYSSVSYVLAGVAPWLRPGSFLLVDDLQFADHAARALREFVGGRLLRAVCADRTLALTAFEVTDTSPAR